LPNNLSRGDLSSLLLILLATSCQESDFHEPGLEELTAPLLSNKDVAHFRSQTCFEKAMIALRNDGTIPIETKGIITLSQSLSLKRESVEDEPDDTLIYSCLFKLVINEKYEIAVGNVFFRITEYGTFFTNIANSSFLSNLNVNDQFFEFLRPIENAFDYNISEGMYEVVNHDNLYFYDTFRKLESNEDLPSIYITDLKNASLPSEISWRNITDHRTDIRRLLNVWGFSVSERHYFDSRNRVDVKFYAQNFLVYAEMGIKTKTQTRGWTGIWRKRYSNEIINGWEMLNLREEWPGQLITFLHPGKLQQPKSLFNGNPGIDIGLSQTSIIGNVWATFNIIGLDINFSNRNQLAALWHYHPFSPGRQVLPGINRERKAIRIIPEDLSSNVTRISLAPYQRRRTNVRKHTLILATGTFEGTVGLQFNNARDFRDVDLDPKSASLNFSYLSSTVMYGAARIGNTWRGVRITFN